MVEYYINEGVRTRHRCKVEKSSPAPPPVQFENDHFSDAAGVQVKEGGEGNVTESEVRNGVESDQRCVATSTGILDE